MAKHIYSFFDNEQECIQSILDIHNEGKPIDLDPMYNQGMFYKNTVQKPKYRFDLNANEKGYDADLLIVDKDINIKTVIIGGEVFNRYA